MSIPLNNYQNRWKLLENYTIMKNKKILEDREGDSERILYIEVDGRKFKKKKMAKRN